MGNSLTNFKDKESPETQMQHIKKYCNDKGYNLVSKYEDLDYSGGTDERPGFQQMFWEVRNNPSIDAVIVYNLSRFARDVLDLNKYLVDLEKYKVDFVSCTEEFLRTDTMYGKFLINIIGSVAQLQREQIAENVRDNMRNRALRGNFLGGIPPLGYILNKETQKFELQENESKLIRLIFEKYLSGDGIIKIRNLLNENKMFDRNDFSVGTLHSILKNIHYTGDFIYSKRRNISRTKKKKTSEQDWIVVENNHPAIVTKQEFQLVQQLMKSKNRSKPENLNRRISGNQFLSGYLQCVSCGHSYYHGPRKNNRGKKFDYYVCGGYKTKGTPYCTNKRGLRIDLLDPIILEVIGETLNEVNFLEMYSNTYRSIEHEIKGTREKVKIIKRQLQTLEEEKSRYLQLIIRTVDNELINEFQNEIKHRNVEMIKLNEELKVLKKSENKINAILEIKEEINELFYQCEYYNKEEKYLGLFKGDIYRNFIDKVLVKDEEGSRSKLTINLKFRKEEINLLKKIRDTILRTNQKSEELIHNYMKKILNEYRVSVHEVENGPPVPLHTNF